MEDLEKSFVQRRGWPRTAIETLVGEARLLLKSHPQEEPPSTEVINVSASGAGVLMPTSLEKGAQVRLQILGEGLPKLDLNAEVRWASESPVSTGKFPAGLKFLNLEKESRAELQAFIELMRERHRAAE
jgi:c-di-GMP-binding flagellar brake protein YcgR